MTFDRFMKEFFAEELKDFPNTVYKNDCWYSFTPQDGAAFFHLWHEGTRCTFVGSAREFYEKGSFGSSL